MKDLLLGSGLLLLSTTLHAQPPGAPPPLQHRWQHDSSMLAQNLRISEGKLRQVQPAFSEFYKNIDALVFEERPRPPRFVDVQKLVKQRDAIVLRVLSKEEGEDFLRMEHLLMPPPEGPSAPGRRSPLPEAPEHPERREKMAPPHRNSSPSASND